MQSEFRSLVGQLMHYATKIAPECGFAVDHFARHMDSLGEQHWKAMERIGGRVS